MLNTIKYFTRLVLFWLVIFFIAKIFFLLINLKDGWSDILELPAILWHGLRLDFSIIGYFSIIPLLLLILHSFLPKIAASSAKIYWWAIVVFVILTVSVDPYFFAYWGQKTNLGFLQFLGAENAGLSSIETISYVLSIGFMVILTIGYAKRGYKYLEYPQKGSWYTSIILLAFCALMIRSSIGKVPINVSSAYYSSNNLHNNTAVNSVWNFLATEVERDKHAALVFFENDAEVDSILSEHITPSVDLTDLIDRSNKPNIVLIVLESFTAKAVGFISGDRYGSTPELDKIMEEGIAYTNAYASSFRSDKGLLAITAGIPSGARQTLTNFPGILANKASIFTSFPSDYHTSFYYGGNLEFANIKVLFKDANMLKSQNDFKSTNKNSWGVHDDFVFKTFADDFISEKRPQFKMLFSLSSHEPFDVPYYQTKENSYLNSIAYTDSCLGVLIDRLKLSDKWDNTVVIITADHGSIHPDNAAIFDTSNFKIPIVITGGLVNQDTTVSEIVSQIDIPHTIASIISSTNNFSQNSLLQPSGEAYYSYHNGLTYVSKNCVQYFDINQGKYLKKYCGTPFEKAYYQKNNRSFFNP